MAKAPPRPGRSERRCSVVQTTSAARTRNRRTVPISRRTDQDPRHRRGFDLGRSITGSRRSDSRGRRVGGKSSDPRTDPSQRHARPMSRTANARAIVASARVRRPRHRVQSRRPVERRPVDRAIGPRCHHLQQVIGHPARYRDNSPPAKTQTHRPPKTYRANTPQHGQAPSPKTRKLTDPDYSPAPPSTPDQCTN